MSYPAAPWQMHGQLWLSLLRVGHDVDDLRPAGVYGVALVRYEEPSPLTYGELLVARPVRHPVRGVTISDIWVDSEASVAGGRELWAIPKELAGFAWEASRTGVVEWTAATVAVEGREVAAARFADATGIAVRTPFRGATWQPAIPEQTETTARLTGSARALPCRGSWRFAAAGPLGWLAGARQLGSFRMRDFRMSFGG